MSDEFELLEQRVTKHRKKSDQAASVVRMTRDRDAAAQSADQSSQRDLTSAQSALVAARKKAKELKQSRNAARELAQATARERADTERELGREVEVHERRQAKLAKAEAALAAARAAHGVTSPDGARKAPRKRSTTAATKATTRKTPAKKTPARTTTKKAATTAAKKTGPRAASRSRTAR